MTKKATQRVLKWFRKVDFEKNLPKTKEELLKLEHLHLCCCCKFALKEIAQFTNIKKLTIGIYGCQKMPRNIHYFKHLEVLDLGITNLNSVHKNLYKLKKLKELYLVGNNLDHLPDGISKLRNLEKLDLRGNTVSKTPKDLIELKKLKYFGSFRNIDKINEKERIWLSTIDHVEKF